MSLNRILSPRKIPPPEEKQARPGAQGTHPPPGSAHRSSISEVSLPSLCPRLGFRMLTRESRVSGVQCTALSTRGGGEYHAHLPAEPRSAATLATRREAQTSACRWVHLLHSEAPGEGLRRVHCISSSKASLPEMCTGSQHGLAAARLLWHVGAGPDRRTGTDLTRAASDQRREPGQTPTPSDGGVGCRGQPPAASWGRQLRRPAQSTVRQANNSPPPKGRVLVLGPHCFARAAPCHFSSSRP